MRSRRLLTPLSSDHEPVWIPLYLQPIGGTWAAMFVADGVLPPEPGTLKSMAFFGATPEEAEREALAYLGASEPEN